jgi:photosystem II stability/assembly factor-like uncharacterized protein
MVLEILASAEDTMSVVTRPRPPRVDEPADVEALEALIEEARGRTRRRRRGYTAAALVAVAAGLLGFYGFDHGGGVTRPQTGPGQPSAAPGVSSEGVSGTWRAAAGLEGADLTALAFDPRHPRIVLAAADNAGVFWSADGGRSWRPLSIAPSVVDVCCLLVDPKHPRIVYAGTAEGVFKSTDAGASWPSVGLPRSFVTALTFDPADARTIFAGSVDGLYRSSDGGASWRHVLTGTGVVRTIAVDPTNPQRLYAGASAMNPNEWDNAYPGKTGVFASGDGGRSWHAAGLQDREVTSLALAPTRPRTLYAATPDDGLFKSTDRGRSWRAIGPEDLADTVLVDPRNPDTVYAGTFEARIRRSILRSTDGGRTWQVIDVGRRAGLLAFDSRKPRTLYVSDLATPPDRSGAGILKSTNGGRSWRELSAGPTAAQVKSIAVDPRNPGTAYAAVGDRGVFKRTAGEWQAANKGLTSLRIVELAVDPSNSATVYAATEYRVFKSTDGAASWQPAGSGVLDLGLLAVRDPQHPDTLYFASGYSGGVRKSTDGGASWQDSTLTDTVVHVHELALAPTEPATLYAGTDTGLFTSTNGGASWQALGGRLANADVHAVAVDPQVPTTVYAGTVSGVFVSTDGGANWSSLGLTVRTYDALAVDPAANLLYAGALGAGIYELKLDR